MVGVVLTYYEHVVVIWLGRLVSVLSSVASDVRLTWWWQANLWSKIRVHVHCSQSEHGNTQFE